VGGSAVRGGVSSTLPGPFHPAAAEDRDIISPGWRVPDRSDLEETAHGHDRAALVRKQCSILLTA
jgi:hypothetical protein